MKYVKMLGLAAVAAAALMAFVGVSTASATVLCTTAEGSGATTGTTCAAGWAEKEGQEIHAISEGTTTLTTSFKNIECKKSTVAGKLANEGSATETVKGNIETLTFEECNCEVNVLQKGELEIHWIEGTHNGTLTGNKSVITTQCSTIFGAVHCIYTTSNTHLGTLTGSATTGKTATLDVEGKNIPLFEPTSSLCPEKSAWDAKYEITTPDTLNVAGHT